MPALEYPRRDDLVIRFTDEDALDHATVASILTAARVPAAAHILIQVAHARAVDHCALAELVHGLRSLGARVHVGGATAEHIRVLRYLGLADEGDDRQPRPQAP